MSQQTPETPLGTPPSRPPQQESVVHSVQTAFAAQPDKVKRFVALFIDGIILGVLGSITVFGALAATAGWLVRDAIIDGQSPGKKLMGLRAVMANGQHVTFNESARRNWMFALGALGTVLGHFTILGALAGLAVSCVGGLIGLYECYRVVTDQPRLGDQMAGTHVVVDSGVPAVSTS